jgi:hypothetical protein
MVLCAFRRRHPVILGGADGYGSPNNCARERRLTSKKQPMSVSTDQISGSILLLRGQRVILDRDLAAIYDVETRTLNQAVKRNADRFPEDFMFQLTPEEVESLRSQFVILKSGRGQHAKFLPRAFTEHGAIQAANILNSPRAVRMGIHVVRAFVQLRSLLASNRELARKFAELEHRVSTHDQAIVGILKTIRELMNPPEPKRRPIGFVDLEEKK